MPTFACPYCGKSLQAAASRERVTVNCPHCTQPFEITDPKAPVYTPPPIPVGPPQSSSSFGQAAPETVGFTCPLCHSHAIPVTRERTSAAGWVMIVIMALLCFPLFWIGFYFKEDYQTCRTCGKSLS